MKKFVFLITLSILIGSCSGGTNDSLSTTLSLATTDQTTSQVSHDVTPPILMIDPLEVTIKYGEEFDFLKGVTAVDDIDGDVKNLLEINKMNFDNKIPGTYTILYMALDNSGNHSNLIQRKVTVLPKEPTIEEAGYTNAEAYLGTITGEVSQPTSTPSCFPGAWYRKVVSTKDSWLGIEGTIQIPTVQLDDARYDEVNKRYLDNPSIYLGGNAFYESDVGLSLMVGCTNKDNCTRAALNGSYFRPFWRYISTTPNPGTYENYSVSCNGNNCFGNYDFTKTEFYYLPGDVLRISVFSPEPDYLQLKIEVIAVSTIEKSVQLRANLKQPQSFLSPKFKSNGQGRGSAEFKRVNAIDQVNNEGKPTILTNAKILNAIWLESYLYRKINQVVYKVPFIERRASYMACPISGNPGNTSYPDAGFSISYDSVNKNLGGEVINIHPKGLN